MSGNHLADQPDKDREKGDKCSCGGSWKEIAWCAELNQECDYVARGDCREAGIICCKETRLECQRCGGIVECE